MHQSDLSADVLARIRLADYVAGRYGPEELAEFQQWIDQDPRRAAVLEDLRHVWRVGERNPVPLPDTAAMWTAIADKTIHQPAWVSASSSARRTLVRWAAGAALAVLILIGISIGERRPRPSHTTHATYTTRAGQQAKIALGDGTTVTLAPQSTLSLGSAFGAHTRTVSLSGEANFHVTTTTGVPFIVQTGTVSTRVLGTTFNVRHYAHESAVQIAVSSGKVVTSRDRGTRGTAPVTVPAGRAAQVTDSTAVITPVNDLGQYTDWAQGQLVFKGTPVPVLLAAMGRWYGYQFRLSDSAIAAKTVTLSLKVSDPEDAMTIVRGLLDVDMAFDGHVVTITARRRETRLPVRTRLVPARKDMFKPSMEVGK
jgi:ferric-dicitrate binding protein FerR (iron transport regulator)